MKWQKNTGVMPCEGDLYVELRFGDGSWYIGKARYQDWSLERSDKITHWCIAEHTPFDYVEPKVWTVEHHPESDIGKVYKNGEWQFSVSPEGYAQSIADALNQMEERNGTV